MTSTPSLPQTRTTETMAEQARIATRSTTIAAPERPTTWDAAAATTATTTRPWMQVQEFTPSDRLQQLARGAVA